MGSRTTKVLLVVTAGAAAVGAGALSATALPDVSGVSGGHSSVDWVPAPQASETGIEHAQDAPSQGPLAEVPPDAAPPIEAAGSRADGLETAQDDVTNDHAAAVLDAVAANDPGPSFGLAVADVASGGQAPVSVPPEQASAGLSHRP